MWYYTARREHIMNYRKRRANAWAGLYAGLVGTPAGNDGDATESRDEPRRGERND